MQKNGATAAANARPQVPIQNTDDVIMPILSPQGFGAGADRQSDRPVIAPVAWILAPAVAPVEGSGWQGAGRAGQTVAADA